MAVFIIMTKEYENEEKVVYKYGLDEKNSGVIEYNKDSGMISQQEPIVSEFYPDDFSLSELEDAWLEWLLKTMAILLNELRLNLKSAILAIRCF
ncbi:hypothetical protein [Listeria booriae]|uniref:hypothetical protein n=1 Tax=Listeria booriae TaxID=1552123 RepID=UPI0021AB4DD9|nr:hypothetical protein [Listeria booriae]